VLEIYFGNSRITTEKKSTLANKLIVIIPVVYYHKAIAILKIKYV